nr:VOC family protein [uncultured Steroidobacter sp.]
MNSKAAPAGIIQMAYVVEDIGAAMPRFTQALGIGPWFYFETFPFERLEYRGRPSQANLSLCLGMSGGMMYELIQQRDDQPSVYNEVIRERGWGFHHYAIGVAPADYQRTVADYVARGYDKVLDATVSIGAQAAYVDARRDLHGMIEIIEMTAPVHELFTMIRSAGAGWDGRDPIRRLG